VTGLSVADIDRWQPGDVREVFHAARSRNEANQLASHALATLPAFQSWGGAAADAAKNFVEPGPDGQAKHWLAARRAGPSTRRHW
jgi:hypothetical protein